MLKTLITSCNELIFPSFCLQCNKRLPFRELPLLCDECRTDISFIRSPRCECCGIPFPAGGNHLCGLCLKTTYAFDTARASVKYREPVTSLISSLKFNGTLTGLASLAHLAVNSPGNKDLSEPDLILPVPLHIRRLRERTFNQAKLIAASVFPLYQDRIKTDILIRHRPTQSQTGLSGKNRRRNLANAFSLNKPESITGKKILLVDDVFTTGSTVNECAKILRKSGAKRIEVFTLARAL